MTKVTHTYTQNTQYLLLFHGISCFSNVPQRYVYTCLAAPVILKLP